LKPAIPSTREDPPKDNPKFMKPTAKAALTPRTEKTERKKR